MKKKRKAGFNRIGRYLEYVSISDYLKHVSGRRIELLRRANNAGGPLFRVVCFLQNDLILDLDFQDDVFDKVESLDKFRMLVVDDNFHKAILCERGLIFAQWRKVVRGESYFCQIDRCFKK